MSTNYSRCNSVVCSRYYTCRRAQMISNTEPTDYANYISEITGEWACGVFGEYRMYEPMDTVGPLKEESTSTLSARMPKFASIYNTPPTRQCTVCEELENPNAEIGTSEFWICPTCMEKLRFVLSSVVLKKEDRIL